MPNKKIIIQKEFPFDKNGNIREGTSQAEKMKKGVPTLEEIMKQKRMEEQLTQLFSTGWGIR